MFSATVILFLVLISLIVAYNVDVQFPIVYEHSIKNGRNKHRSSYFGYSVMMYGGGNTPEESWIKIGAPRSNSTKGKFIEPGTAYHCPIKAPCQEINFEHYDYDPRNYIREYEEKFNNAWFGVDMDVDEVNNRTIICGHRCRNWHTTKRELFMQGTCYYDFSEGVEKLALLNVKGHAAANKVYKYGVGQSGISIEFPKSNKTQEVHIGAPGLYNWRGGTALDVRKQTSVEASRRKRSFTSIKRYIPDVFLNKYVEEIDYQGYAVTTGYFFSKDEIQYVSGGPRADDKGKVLIFTYPEYNDRPINVITARKGLTRGEYFGSALAAGDITGDGYDDLVVGAPLFAKYWEEGRIYVYLGSKEWNMGVPKSAETIDGIEPGGRFGTGISVGNLNQDKYADVIVGAPYENDHRGVVYIYYGSPDGLVESTRQRIEASSIDTNLRGFGIAFSRFTDIDKNGCNDIAIGSYLSEQAVVLRSYPVARIHVSAKASLSQIPRNETSFDVDIFVKCSAYVDITPIDLKLIIKVDDNFRRASINTDNSTIKVDTTGQNQTIKVFLKDKIINYIDPFKIQVQVSHIKNNNTEINEIKISDTVEGIDSFCKTCAVVDEAKSTKTTQVILTFMQECGEDNRCDSNLALEAAFKELESDNTHILGSKSSLPLDITITNTGEVANLLEVEIILPEDIDLALVPTECDKNENKVLCSLENLKENGKLVLSLEIDLEDFKLESVNENALMFNITVFTKSYNLNDKNNNLLLKLDLSTDATIHLYGQAEEDGYSFVKNETTNILEDVVFNHLYEIEKENTSPIFEVDLKIYVPIKYHDEKDTYEITNVSTSLVHLNNLPFFCQKRKYNNRFKTEKEPVKFAKYTDLPTDAQQSPPSNRTLYLNCFVENIECIEIYCSSIGPFLLDKSTAKLKLPITLNSKLVLEKLLGQNDIIYFTTVGFVSIKKPYGLEKILIKSQTSTLINAGFRETVIELWMIIVAVIVGIFVLTLVIIALVKLGFFKRKTKSKLITMMSEMGAIAVFSPLTEPSTSSDVKGE